MGNPVLAVPNLLLNASASEGAGHWRSYGNAVVEGSEPHFAVRYRGHFHQDVAIPPQAAGKYALLIGRVASERINANGSITGLPYLYGYMMAAGGTILAYLQGQHMLSSATAANRWVVAWGAFPIPAGTTQLRFFLMQAERAGDPQNGSAASFDDLGLYVAADAASANELVRQYCRPEQLLVVHDTLAAEAQRLVTAKEQQGTRVALILTSAVGSPPTAQQISARIWEEHARSAFPVGSVLLIGDAQLVPPHVRTDPESSDGIHATDLYFGAPNDADYAPVLPVGRLPAATAAEARAMIDKLLAFTPAALGALLFGFDPELAAYGPADAALLQAGGIAADVVTWTFPMNCNAQQAGDVLARLREGRSFAAYYGHGSVQAMGQLCAQHLVPPAPRHLPVILSGGCYNGQFDAGVKSIAETLLLEPTGAVAVIASTRTGGYGYAYRFMDGFIAETIASGQLGSAFKAGLRSAIQAASAAGSPTGEGSFTKHFVEKMTLLGDPGLLVRPPPRPSPRPRKVEAPKAARAPRPLPPERRCPHETDAGGDVRPR